MELEVASLSATVTALRSGTLDLHTFVDQMCDRVDRLDSEIASLLPEEGRRARLHAEADLLLRQYPEPAERPPLFGALVGVKDIFHVDGFVTRAGSSVPPEAPAGREAVAVTTLRGAGALILGKTVTTEFAYFEPGPTRNPHNLEHTPGGSSSGSAAAVAAGLCTLSLGTQTIGSVIRPASFCGVVGFKPTFERIPSEGLIYFSPSMDHVGIFTQDAFGMDLAASVLCDGWRGAQAQLPAALGVPDDAYLRQAGDDMHTAVDRWIEVLHYLGVRIVRFELFEEIESLNRAHRRLVFAEFARRHAELFARYGELYRPRTREIIETGRGVSDPELGELRRSGLRERERIRAAMEEHRLDGLLTPAAPGPAPAGIHATGDPNLNLPWTHAGLPALSLPAGNALNGLPLGMQLVAPHREDETLLGWALALEGRV